MDPGHVCSRIRAHTSVASFPDPAKGGRGWFKNLPTVAAAPGHAGFHRPSVKAIE
jgi:hypothetical protein